MSRLVVKMKRLKNKGIRIGTLIGVALVIAVLLVILLPGGVVMTPIGIPSVDSGVVLASPDTERQSPDVLIAQDNLTGTVTDIQDDPDSPDTNWLTAISNNVNTVCHVSFPTPTGNPTTGAGLQEFKIWVRKDAVGGVGAGIPTVMIDLYENGSFVANIMAASNVTYSTGQLFSGTWDANLLTNADGSAVECYIFGDAVGGAPNNRVTVGVGAVEWNVDYYIPPDISNTPTSFDFGTLSEGGTYETTGGLTTAYFTVTNNSAFTVNITIGGTDMTGGTTWTLSNDGSAGNMIYGLNAGLEGGSYNVIVNKAGGNTLVSNLLASNSQDWGLQLLAPTTMSDGASKSGTVTLTATQA